MLQYKSEPQIKAPGGKGFFCYENYIYKAIINTDPERPSAKRQLRCFWMLWYRTAASAAAVIPLMRDNISGIAQWDPNVPVWLLRVISVPVLV